MMRFGVIATLALTACQPKGVAPRRTVAVDSADQVYAAMKTTLVRRGIRTSDVIADSAWMYQTRQVFDLKHMTVKMFDTTGALVSTITADKGIYHIRDESLDARGNVVALSSGGKLLKTEHLIYDNRRNLITSDTAFTSTSPEGVVSGAHFEADPGFKNVLINKVKIVQKGKGVRLPTAGNGGKP
jgi:LPS export ABC transporter protein LptC